MKHLLTITKKDLIIQTFRSGGKGGQKQNKVETGVRIIHKESSAVGESRTTRSQYQNKSLALKRLATSGKFRVWISLKAFEADQKQTIEQKVNELMQPKNLKIEIKNEKGDWEET